MVKYGAYWYSIIQLESHIVSDKFCFVLVGSGQCYIACHLYFTTFEGGVSCTFPVLYLHCEALLEHLKGDPLCSFPALYLFFGFH